MIDERGITNALLLEIKKELEKHNFIINTQSNYGYTSLFIKYTNIFHPPL